MKEKIYLRFYRMMTNFLRLLPLNSSFQYSVVYGLKLTFFLLSTILFFLLGLGLGVLLSVFVSTSLILRIVDVGCLVFSSHV